MKNGPYELVVAPAEYPGKKYRGRYVYEHHLVWWQNTGQLVPPGHDVHHKNGKKRDNRFENFELKTKGKHSADHGRARRGPTIHGTYNAYRHHGCRCEPCRRESQRRMNEWRWRTGRRKKRHSNQTSKAHVSDC